MRLQGTKKTDTLGFQANYRGLFSYNKFVHVGTASKRGKYLFTFKKATLF